MITTAADLSRSLGRVDVVIPALNEESSIASVLRDLPPVRNVIVVDNGSTDETARVAEALGAIVVRESRRGYGSACLRGLQTIRDRQTTLGEEAPLIVVFLDADYSDHPEELTSLVAPVVRGSADFVLGSRLLGSRTPGAMPPQSIYGNRLACWLMWYLLGARFTDLGPFRAIRYSSLLRLRMTDTTFGWTIEMQIKAVQAGLRYLEIPASYRRRIGDSKISGTLLGTLRAGAKILWTLGRYGIVEPFRRARNGGAPAPTA